MQGLSDGYFIIPYTIGDYLATNKFDKIDVSRPEVLEAEHNVTTISNRLLSIKGKRTVASFHRELAGLSGLLRHVAHSGGA